MLQQERVRRIIEVLAIGVGISGVSLSNLRSTQPVIFYISILILIIILVSLLFTWKKSNIFIKKDEINQIWQQLISGSFESVEAFAGDVSWIQRDKQKIQDITAQGIKVSVLCHNPFQKETAQSNIKALFEVGAKVKFFDSDKYYPPYGLLIDGDNSSIGTALTVDREPKPNIPENREGLKNIDIYNYNAIRYIPRTDSKHIQALSTLFDAMWEQAREGVALIPLDIGYLMRNELPDLLRLVKHYSHITEADISTETIHIGEIFASTTYVKMSSLSAIAPICYSYRDQNIPEYKPTYCMTNHKHSLMLPPILEAHNDKLVAVDGTHRLFHLYAEQQRTGAFCLIVHNAPELPSKPIPFKDVRAWPRNLSRDNVFIKYNHSLYRNFVPLDEKLTTGNFSDGTWHSSGV